MYMPRIDEAKCTRCGECLDVCPTDVFEAGEDEVNVAHPGDCIGCESCVGACPEDAVTLEEI
jgi:NAD-dependent dihydropyrimidine dehydrogenase PreA subunit